MENRGQDRKSTRLNSSHTVIYTLSLHDALPIWRPAGRSIPCASKRIPGTARRGLADARTSMGSPGWTAGLMADGVIPIREGDAVRLGCRKGGDELWKTGDKIGRAHV